MKYYQEYFSMSNGIKIQKVGFGTWQMQDLEILGETISECFRLGLNHIDSAWDYQNESLIKQVLAKTNKKRSEYFVTSKLPSHIKGYDITLEYFNKSLTNFGFEYLDLYLIHAPWPWDDIGRDCTAGNIESWKAMIKLYQQKKIRSIGVSNFSITDLEAIIKATGFIPHVNQIRFFVGCYDKELVDYCHEKGILIEAYSPLGTGKVFDDIIIKQMADKYQVTVAQLCMKYCLQHDTLPIFKTNTISRIKENIDLEFEISKSDMDFLDTLKEE